MTEFPLESFVFYRSFRDAIEEMNESDKLSTLLAIIDYALYGVEPDLKGILPRAVFTVARPSIDANRVKRANGKKGGRPKTETTGLESENQRFSKSESTVSVSEAVSGSVSGTLAGSETKAKRKKYGQYGWVRLTDAEHSRLLNELGDAEFNRCVQVVDESAQSTGNKNGWRDWNLVIRKCHRDGWGRNRCNMPVQSEPSRRYDEVTGTWTKEDHR